MNMKPFWNRQNIRRPGAIILLLGGLALVGCVPSLNPLYLEKDLVHDPAFLGDWSEDGTEDKWRFEPGEGRSYRVTFREGDEEGEFIVHLLELDGYRYLDFEPVRDGLKAMGQTGFYRMHWVPTHTFARVELKDGVLRMAMVNPDWLTSKLEQDPGCLAHRRRGDDDLVLTASTEELQRFLQEHRTELFGDPMELRRLKTGP
jgi:hypothetical protein